MKANDPKRPARSRNFLARHPLMKKGGVHQKSKKAERKAAKQALASSCVKEYEYAGKKISVEKNLFASIFAQDFSRQSLL